MKSIILHKLFLVAFLNIFFTVSLSAQTPIEVIVDDYRESVKNHIPELLYIQTSKGVYETGEDVWFKVYQLDAQTMGLSLLSHTLYVQLFTESDSLVWQEKYPVENGIVEGHIYLDEQLPDGNYWMEAYTRHSFYKDSTPMNGIRNIRIQKNITETKKYSTGTEDTFRFDIFPEGGHLVAGLASSLSFKATDGKGTPVDISGVLYEDGNFLTAIETVHAGMGSIPFTPMPGKQYHFELTNGKRYELPAIQAEGISLRLFRQTSEALEFVVSQTGREPSPIYLMGQIRGVVYCAAKGILRDSLIIKMPLEEFPLQGIAEFTLFNNHLIPVAERLVYVHPGKKLYITAETDKSRYELREQGQLKIKVTDEEGNPVKAHLGVSIYDKLYTNPGAPTTILTHCYLSSQVKGNVYDPAYYFDEKNENRLEALDLLLQTQGWRSYLWSRENIPVERTELVKDEMTGTLTVKDKKMKGSEQLIQISDSEGNAEFVWADSAGYFLIPPELLKDLRGGYIYLKPMLTKNYGPKLELDDPFTVINDSRIVKNKYCPYIDLDQIEKGQILRLPTVSRDSVIQLDEVTITAKTRKIFRDKFMGQLDSLAQLNLSSGWVCECANGIYLNDYMPGYTHHIYHTASYSGKRLPPVVGKTYKIIKYVQTNNGVFVEDVKDIVYNGPVYSEEELLRMNNYWRTKGYYAAREFYQPDGVDMLLSIPDARNTLLWAPSVITDEKGEATVSFYCSDINTEFTGRIEGVGGDGLLGSSGCDFRVLRNIP